MGVCQKVNIVLINHPVQGEYILVHAGFAIEKIDSHYFHFLNDSLYEMLEGKKNE
jgi:hydrogenase maturation factor